MPVLANILLPTERANAFAQQTDSRTAPDIGYVAKDALCECFGERRIRPYRIQHPTPDQMQIIGYIAEGDVLKPTATGAKVVSHIDFRPWHSQAGDELTLEVRACPMQAVRGGGQAEGSRGKLPREVDVAKIGHHPSRLAAYFEWLLKRVRHVDSGCLPITGPRFTQTDGFTALRKSVGGTVKAMEFPSFDATIKVRVVNARAFERFLLDGIGRQRGFGYGLMIPVEVLNEFKH